MASVEHSIGAYPFYIMVDTTDSYAAVQAVGYLNGQTLLPCTFVTPAPPAYDGQLAVVRTTDMGTQIMQISISGSDTSLVPRPVLMPDTISTTPPASSASTLSIGTAYHNTLGYDVMITVYLNITAALSASILLGVGSTSNPTQQTIVSGLTLSVLGVIPVNIYLPNGYYAKLSTSGTITMSISGQIAMPV